MKSSPYLRPAHRLADVVAAIQVMGTYPWASRKVEDWPKSLGEPMGNDGWAVIFKNHPEIFRFTDKGWVSLRWRHGYLKTFDTRRGREISEVERDSLTAAEVDALTHKPLTSDQIEALIRIALDFHVRAIAYEQERRWPAPLICGLISAVLSLVGVILGAYITSRC